MSNEGDLSNVKEIINEIEEKSAVGSFIYCGEPKCYKRVSSNLWREYRSEKLDIERVQQEILKSAKKHIGQLPNDYRPSRSRFSRIFLKEMNEAVDFEILTELQHYGGKTNLIDFSTDYLIALFFACDGHYDKEGRIVIQNTKEIEDIIWNPQNPRHRVVAQKSIFIRHPNGYFEPNEEETVAIPKDIKQTLLEYLRKYHGISTETIYNDLQGFIRNQNVHVSANIHFFRGIACQDRADIASTTEEKQQEYEDSIKHYTEAIKSKPDYTVAYNNRGIAYHRIGKFENALEDYDKAIEIQPDNAQTYSNRGEALLHLNEMEKAKTDLITAKEIGVDIVASFRNDYESVEDFEQKTGSQLPEDIAAMLTTP